MNDPTQLDPQEIAARAYEIWERDGRPEGRSDEHWAQAVSELTQERAGATPDKSGASAPGSKAPSKPKATKAADKSKTATAAKGTTASRTKAKSETTTKRTVSKKKS